MWLETAFVFDVLRVIVVFSSGRSVPKLRRSLSSLVGGNGPSFVPPQAPRSVRMRALRRLDESHRPCAWISSTNVLVSSEGCLLVDHTSKGELMIIDVAREKFLEDQININFL